MHSTGYSMGLLGPVLIGIPLLLLFLGALVAIVLLLVWRKRSSGRPDPSEEARMVQEMYRSMDRLSERIEALETILLRERRSTDDDRPE